MAEPPTITDAEIDAATGHTPDDGADIDSIYRALQRGAGRELVTDGNVAELISLAESRGNSQLEYLLREWRSSCGNDPALPDLAQIQGNPPPADRA